MIISIDHNGISYSNYEYDDLVSILTQEIVDAAIKAQQTKEAKALRKATYTTESDPLFIEWQYDKTPEKEQQWRDKVAEIKVKYPLA